MDFAARGGWLDTDGEHVDVVVSSRVRLARNLAGLRFVGRATDVERNEVLDMVHRTSLFRDAESGAREAARPGGTDDEDTLMWLPMARTSELDRMLLAERHLVSQQFADSDVPRAVAVSNDESVSVMVNEEDHLRLQAMRGGAALDDAYAAVSTLDRQLESVLDFAFDERWGYLTACPTNVGCGIRISVMLHLPALRIAEEMDRVRRAAKDLHLAVRGFHGEGSESIGDLYQVSNQRTLGVTTEELLETFRDDIVPRLVDYERTARTMLRTENPRTLEDRVHRALAVLRGARLLETKEAINLLSRVRLGTTAEVLEEIDLAVLHRLLLQVQPGHLAAHTGIDPGDDAALQAARADIVRAELA